METSAFNFKTAFSVLTVLFAMLSGFTKAMASEPTIRIRNTVSIVGSKLEATAGCACSFDSGSYAPKTSTDIEAAPRGSSSLSLLVSTGHAVTNLVRVAAAAASNKTRSTASALGRAIMPGCTLEESGKASYYGPGVGNKTATGERFSRHGMTAAHWNRSLLGESVVFRDAETGKTVKAKINDLCPGCKPSRNGKVIDLAEGLFKKFAPTSQGLIKRIEIWICK